jgi:hypothetical protein
MSPTRLSNYVLGRGLGPWAGPTRLEIQTGRAEPKFIVVSSTSVSIFALLKGLRNSFGLKDLENLHYPFGIKVKKVHDGLVLSQEKYAHDILKHVNKSNYETTSIPLIASNKLSTLVVILSVLKTI